MIRLEKRAQPSQFWTFATPFLAVIMTMIVGGIMFAALGQCNAKHLRSNGRIVKKQLVKITHAVEEQALRVLVFKHKILPHRGCSERQVLLQCSI